MYASDDALCYQHLSADMQPTGSKKQIPYASIEFVGARARAGTPHTCLGSPAGLLPRPAQAAASSTRAGLALSHPLSPCAAGRAGPFDEQQFVVKCKGRAFTFMCDSVETRTKWIKNISMLAGCSASTEVCHKTTTMGH